MRRSRAVGVTHELGPQKDNSAISQLSMRLKAQQGAQHQLVVLNDQSAELTISLAAVWASATWVEGDEPPAPVGLRRR